MKCIQKKTKLEVVILLTNYCLLFVSPIFWILAKTSFSAYTFLSSPCL